MALVPVIGRGADARLNGGTLGFCYRFRARRILAPPRAWIGATGRVSEYTAIGRIPPRRTGSAPDAPQAFSAGEALVQPSLNRISIRGRVVQVEPKVMQVLLLMAERPGTVIARQQFLDTVWAGTVGDDYLLNRAISELRRILDDDPQAPRYIETIRKGGYRLVAPVAPARVAAALVPTTVDDAEPGTGDAAGAAIPQAGGATPPAGPATLDADAGGDTGPDAPAVPASPAPLAHAMTRQRPARPRLPMLAVTAGAMAMVALAIWRPWQGGPAPDAPATPGFAYVVQPLTSFVGRELEPALSPDGSRVAFIWDGEGAFNVYVKAIGSEQALRLGDGAGVARHPLWTPDGRALLYARSDADAGVSILRVSALGGPATRVFHDPGVREIRGMALSPDGARIAYAARHDAATPYRLHLAELATGEHRALTDPAAGTLGDLDPRFAPDGHSIVFARAVNEVTRDLHRLPAGGGAPERLTFDNRKINGLAWSPDGQRILFTSTRSGLYALWSLGVEFGDLVPVALGSEDVHQPATAPGVEAIAFEQWTHRSRLRQIDLATGTDADTGRHFQSTRWDSNPAWSPDGMRIAFSSNRGGPHAIWVSAADGSGPVQIASFGGSFIDNPAWSPDGRLIAFDASPDGHGAIHVVSSAGGPPRPLVDGPGENRRPAWSRDGAWLYFESNRSGEWRVYAQPAAGGQAEPVSPGAGMRARESVDGRFVLYARPDTPGLWRLPRRDWTRAGGATGLELLVADLDPADSAGWAEADAGVYYVRRPEDSAPVLSLQSPEGATTDLLPLPRAFEGWGFDVSPDQSRLLFSELASRESDLRLAVPRRVQAATMR